MTQPTPVLIVTQDSEPLQVESLDVKGLLPMRMICYIVVTLTCLFFDYALYSIYMALGEVSDKLHQLGG